MIVRIVASVTAVTGLFQFFRHGLSSYWHFLAHVSRCAELVGPLFATVGFVMMIIPVTKIIAGVGLFMCRRWAWLSAIAVLTLDFLIGFQAAVRMCMFSFNRPAPVIPELDPNTVVKFVSMWPTYIISIIAIVSVLVLIQKPIREQFEKQTDLT